VADEKKNIDSLRPLDFFFAVIEKPKLREENYIFTGPLWLVSYMHSPPAVALSSEKDRVGDYVLQ